MGTLGTISVARAKPFELALRSLQASFVCVWSAFWISSALVVCALTLSRKIPLAMARRFWGPGLLWAAGAKVHIQGTHALNGEGPYIFVMNHQSMLDIPAAFTALPVNVRFVAKKELAWIPFLGWYIWAMGMIFVDRRNRQRAIKSMERAAEIVRGGANVVIFPEGTYRTDGQIGAFKNGAFRLALETGAAIVPVAIEGSGNVLRGWQVSPGVVRLAVGEPIPMEGLSADARDTLADTVRAHVVALHHSLRHASAPGDARHSPERAGGLLAPTQAGISDA